jgi:hypothetical protein
MRKKKENVLLTFSRISLVPMVIVFLEKDDDEGSSKRVELRLAERVHLLSNTQKVHHKIGCGAYFDFHGDWLCFLLFSLSFEIELFFDGFGLF